MRARRARRHSQAGMTLVEVLVAMTISGLVLAPVGGWMVLTLEQQGPTAGRFNDSAQSRLLNTYVTRDVASAEHLMDGTNGALRDCAGGTTQIDRVVMNAVFIGTEEELVVYAVGKGVGGLSLYRRTCSLTSSLTLTDEIEILRGLRAPDSPGSPSATASLADPELTFEAFVMSDADPSEILEMRVRATRRADFELAGANGSVVPIARITQVSRTERTQSAPARITLSAAQSWDLDSESLVFRWFQDGDEFGGEEQAFEFSAPGEYVVTLEVEDDQGNVSEASTTIEVLNQPPLIESAAVLKGGEPVLVVVPGDTVQLVATVSDLDDPPSAPTWRIPGVVAPLSGTSVDYTFPGTASTGPYEIVVEVTDGVSVTTRIVQVTVSDTAPPPPGGSTQISPPLKNVVSGPPRADGHTTADQGFGITFTATAPSVFDGWELLSGSDVVAMSSDVVWAYSVPPGTSGVFTIRQKRLGGAASIDTPFRVNRAPTVGFDAPGAPGSYPQTVQFADATTDDFGTPTKWEWNFGFIGAGWTSQNQNPQFTYSQPGTYTVSLTVTDTDGAQSVASRAVTIAGVPPAPEPPRWNGANVEFDPIPGAARFRVTTTHTGFEADGVTACTRSGVNATLSSAGPFSTSGGTNTCPVGPRQTSATLSVEANGMWGPPSLAAVRSVP